MRLTAEPPCATIDTSAVTPTHQLEIQAMATTPSSIGAVRTNLTRLHNEQRTRYGVKTVLYQNISLNSTAQGWATQMAEKNYWRPDANHTRPNGQTFAQWWNAKGPAVWCCGKTYVGENMAYNYDTNVKVMAAWMNSTNHRANILNGNYNLCGFGVSDRNGVRWWVAHFVRG